MKIIIEDFKDAAFTYEGTRHQVEKAKIINNIAVIITNHKTFSWTESELKHFYDEVSFVAPEAGVVVAQSNVLNAEVIQANALSVRLTESLESVFNEISNGLATDKTYKKAEMMVKASNAIINVQMANYKYLTLNK
jgi:hypothetical protein